MRKKRIDVQHCSDTHGEKEKILEKDAVMKEVVATMPEGELILHCSLKVTNETCIFR
jgi:hypothetical protein